jgi:predicted nucleotidyltransferase
MPNADLELRRDTLERDPMLAEVIRRLVGVYQPERIYLFGSRARGPTGPDSDYDVLVIVPDGSAPERTRSSRAYEALWGLKVSTDVLVWTRSAFESRLHLQASLPATVMREGQLLHAA